MPTQPGPDRPRRTFTTRQCEKRAALVSQPWPEFFRNLAIETAVIAVIVGGVAAWILLVR